MSDREKDGAVPEIDRREALRRVGLVPVAAGLALSPARLQAAQEHVHQSATKAAAKGTPYAPKFFTAHEWATVRVLSDQVIPADERSGSATEALVPEFVDFILDDPLAEARDRESLQTRVRGGLAWLDRECRGRFSKAFVECAVGERTAVLDDIAWPEKALAERAAGAAFFTLFRDLVASGFWSSRIGVEDLQYTGNTFVAEWKGCPPAVLAKIALLTLAGLAICAPGRASESPAGSAGAAAGGTVNSIGMKLVRIPAGEFDMGSAASEPGHVANEGPVHHVRITRAFEMGVHEVTNAQFRAFAEGTAYETEAQLDVEGGFGIDFDRAVVIQDPHTDWRNPGFPGFLPGPDHPVLLVSWHDAEAFCKWLSAKEGRTYRLPTEAEWEYAARAGTKTPWWTGADPTALATTGNTADAALRSKVPRAKWAAAWDDGHAFLSPVGSFPPNGFGLHDMHGNVWEWCLDWYGADAYAKSPVDDPQGPASGGFRTIRGGGWWNDAKQNRSAQRIYFKPTFRYCLLSGFRVVRELP